MIKHAFFLAHQITFFIFFNFREHQESMVKLAKNLSEGTKKRRCHMNRVTIQITILAWLVEFFGFLTIFLGTFILGHGNSITTIIMQTLTQVIFFNILPCAYLVNRSDIKNAIIETNWFRACKQLFNV